MKSAICILSQICIITAVAAIAGCAKPERYIAPVDTATSTTTSTDTPVVASQKWTPKQQRVLDLRREVHRLDEESQSHMRDAQKNRALGLDDSWQQKFSDNAFAQFQRESAELLQLEEELKSEGKPLPPYPFGVY